MQARAPHTEARCGRGGARRLPGEEAEGEGPAGRGLRENVMEFVPRKSESKICSPLQAIADENFPCTDIPSYVTKIPLAVTSTERARKERGVSLRVFYRSQYCSG